MKNLSKNDPNFIAALVCACLAAAAAGPQTLQEASGRVAVPYSIVSPSRMAAISSRRLAKELREINADGCPVGINLVSADSFEKWLFSLEVMGESEYSVRPYPCSMLSSTSMSASDHRVKFLRSCSDSRPNTLSIRQLFNSSLTRLTSPPFTPCVCCASVLRATNGPIIVQHVYSNGHVCAHPLLAIGC